MGRKRRFRGKNDSFKRDIVSAEGRTEGGDGEKKGKDNWFSTFILRSRPFEAYYQAMGIMDKEEWPAFMQALKDPLPACFRIHSDCTFVDQVKTQLMKHLSAPMLVEGKEVKAVQELPWYKGGLAYRLGCDRRFIRKQPHLAEFHSWLTSLMESGNITRQEAVSMLPPLFLDVQPSHLVLDMCAAPGSKTAQLIEMVSAPTPTTGTANPTGDGQATGKGDGEVGLVVANDSDRDRAYMLAHQCKRVKSPAICITWCAAQSLPNLGAAGAEKGSDKGIFDRVLADVPCSGDGTLRKQPSIWRTWTVAGGLGLHPLQLLITLRGAAMTKIGGKLVYSTCSLNPIEDEAVVAEVLKRCKGNLVLEDCHGTLPGLMTRPGLHSWPVLTGSARFKGTKTPRRSRVAPRPPAPPAAAAAAAVTAADGTVGARDDKDIPAAEPPAMIDADGRDSADTSRFPVAGQEGGDSTAKSTSAATGPAAAHAGVDRVATAREGGNPEAEGQGEREGGEEEEEEGGFVEPPVASETPLEDAVKAGLRHHPSLEEVDTASSRKMLPSFFPPSAESAKAFKLERCMRMLPQDQDTGGFFVAVLVKTGPILWQDLLSPGESLVGDDDPPASLTTAADATTRSETVPPSTTTLAAPTAGSSIPPEDAAEKMQMAAGAPGAVDGTTPSAAALNTGLAVGKQGSSAEGVDTASNGGGLDHTIGRTDAGNDHEASGIQAAATESTLSSSVPEQGASESSLKGNGACADDSGIRSGGRGGRGRGGGGGRGRGRGKGRGRGRGRRNAERPQDAEREEYVPLEAERWPGIKKWFGMSDDFPVERLYTRKEGSRGVSYVAPATKRYLLDDPAGSRLQMVHTGVKVFERNSSARSVLDFRVCQEGLDLVLPYMTRRVTREASAEDVSRALDGEVVPVSTLSPPVQKALEDQEEGIFVLAHTVQQTGRVFTACVWKGRGDNIAAMINKDLILGLRLEMKALDAYVEKAEAAPVEPAWDTTLKPAVAE